MILVLVALAARFVFFSHAPTLEDVLSQKQIRNSFDSSLFIAALLAFSLLALSLAKGYEILKRNRSITGALLPEEKNELCEREDEELTWKIEELTKTKEFFIRENAEQKDQLNKLTSKLEEMDQSEQMLKKSNVSLSKECERLKSENEILILKVNSLIKPKASVRKPKSNPKTIKPKKVAARLKSKK
jgi:septal ring factor EnvC (AmiA/AmiB activator)